MTLRTLARLLTLGGALAALLLLAACAPITRPSADDLGGTVPAVLPTVTPRPDAPVAAAAEVSAEVSPTVTFTVPAEPVQGGVLVIATTQSPAVLSPLYATSAIEDALGALIVEGLVQVDAAGRYVPALAESLPIVSSDGLTVTYTLRPGVTFSNGAAFTCADVQFTYDAIMSDLAPSSRAGYRDIVAVECPDDLTAVITFDSVYAPYLRLFSFILPRSAGDVAALDAWDYHRSPVGTGPWVLASAEPGSTFQFTPNPYYREAGQPYLDRLVVRVFPDHASAMASLMAGESHVFWDLNRAEFAALSDPDGAAAAQGVGAAAAPTGETELLLFNLADPALDAPDVSTTTANPHPILGDLRVRQAIHFAIDKQAIVEDLLGGQVQVGSTVLPGGPFACPQEPGAFDPAQARALLDAAGWVPGPDGIRTRDGQRLSLRIGTTAGNQLREQTEQALAAMLAEVGIELVAENVPADVLFAGWEADGLRKLGNFDVLLYTTGPSLDPHSHLFQNYHSASIPTAENGGGGFNFSRYANPDVDAWLNEAGTGVDMEARRALYCRVAAQINADLPRIFLYEGVRASGYNLRLQNFAVSPGPQDFTVGSQDWWLVP
jgi:peptide/nickel transport system substrate-binding protein